MPNDNKNLHLDRAQAIITRLAGNSLAVKGWSVAIATATLAYIAKDGVPQAAWLVVIPVIAFWFLDACYLRLEQGARNRYNEIAGQAEADLDYLLEPILSSKGLIRSLFTSSTALFHIPLLVIVIAVARFGPMFKSGSSANSEGKPPRVYISYSWQDGKKADVLAIANDLRESGIDAQVDQYVANKPPKEGVGEWSLGQMRESDFVLVVCSAGYAQALSGKASGGESPTLTGEASELKTQIQYVGGRSLRIIPVGFGPWSNIKKFAPADLLKNASSYVDLNDKTSKEKLVKRIWGSQTTDAPPLGKRKD